VIVTIDVSAAVQIVLRKEKALKFKEAVDNATSVIAPDLFVPELTNTLWKYQRAKIFSEKECLQYIEKGIKLIDTFINSKDLWQEAFGEGVKNNHPVYDMYYAVAARRNGGILITNDGDLAKICKKLSIGYIF
jgi:predicted nucleic acid-binding protein